jgi:hypothetical protein
MTVSEFMRLGGYEGDLSFSTRLGLRSAKIYESIYNKRPRKRRRAILSRKAQETITSRLIAGPDWASLEAAVRPWNNKVCVYPCGVIEQAYRQLLKEGVQPQQSR